MRELSSLFPNLKLEKIKDGRKIKTLKFNWTNNHKIINNNNITEISISEELNRAIEMAKINRFIQPLLTVSNIEKLIKDS